jgi:hypothetical protein
MYVKLDEFGCCFWLFGGAMQLFWRGPESLQKAFYAKYVVMVHLSRPIGKTVFKFSRFVFLNI